MAKFIKQDVSRDASSSGLVVGLSTSDLEKVSLNRKRLKRILRLLYKAKVNSLGLYKAVTMVKFAPQTKYFPGSPASLGVQKAATSQGDFFQFVVVVLVVRKPVFSVRFTVIAKDAWTPVHILHEVIGQKTET